ncbi:MAG: Ig-like domain-containing protein [Clostridiales Family XIII bacterium]|nr:Ig-like domain-containing protein [Clostridiales Family XIII bacterium]
MNKREPLKRGNGSRGGAAGATGTWGKKGTYLFILTILAVSLFLFSTTAVFAASSLNLISSSPSDGDDNLQSQNVGIKLYFDDDVTAQSVQKANAGCFKFTYRDGDDTKELPVKAYFDTQRDKGYILAIIDTNDVKNQMLDNNKSYQLTISGDLTSVNGKTLGSDKTLNFKTIDQSGTTRIYMLLMVAMVGAMIGMTIFQNKRKQKAAAEVAAKGGKVNPYKLAKEKKISVKEAMELIERDRQRRLKRLGIAEGKDEIAAAEAAKKPRDTKKVKAPKPISATGSTYKTGRAALVEKRAKAAIEKYEKTKAANTNAKKGPGNAKSKSRNRSKRKGKRK